MTLIGLEPRHWVLLSFVASGLYVHFRGKIRFEAKRMLDFTILLAPINALMYLFSRTPSTPYLDPASFAQLPAPAQEDHSWAMLQAMISAARADGHMDERERSLVEAELHRLEADPALRARVDAELRRPVDPAEVAARADTPEKAAELYLASVIVCDSTSTMERAYLDALAAALQLPPTLKSELERRAAAGG